MNSQVSDIAEQVKREGSSALRKVYEDNRTAFLQWLMIKYKCDGELAKDIYQQAIVLFYENCLNEKITGNSSVRTYLCGIGKNKYYEAVRSQQKESKLKAEDLEPAMGFPEESLSKVETALQLLGEPCRSLLIQFYYHQRSIEQLAETFQYKNVGSAKNQKFKCLERLRKLVKNDVQFSLDGNI